MAIYRVEGTITRTYDFSAEVNAPDEDAAREIADEQAWDRRIESWTDTIQTEIYSVSRVIEGWQYVDTDVDDD
jgi:hypothetical protein